ncbi:hypothetical protein [Paraliomyxa miuraensis]|uniref:hypothetical protein n=1 Tax=Paraliomyxa miuraensis TaxID=376150 RepID=UPI00225C1141|nr:hypothetical protein [Paraliomyxa miuraensis]MCX4242074.1 hypothetical protein [Paraliomyxa miuraensis]
MSNEPQPTSSPTPGSERRLMRLQAISGLVFSAFLLLHLTNVMLSAFGPGLYDAFQIRIRPIYQFPLFEIGVLMTSLVVHIATGVIRLRRRPRSRGFWKLPLRTRLHRASAYFLLVFIAGHIAATRLPSLLDGVWLGFAGLSYSMAFLPQYFYPYYVLLGLCGLYHGGYGAYLALRGLGIRLPSIAALGLRVKVPLVIGAVLIILGVLSFGGLFYPIADPHQSDFARWAAEVFGTGG